MGATYELTAFSLSDMVDLGGRLRAATTDATDLADACREVVDLLHDSLRDRAGDRACALVRVFRTTPFEQLPPDLQDFAAALAPDEDLTGRRCLRLMATRGIEPDWNDPERSRGHLALPLVSTEAVERSPMIARLISQLGLDIATVVDPAEDVLVDASERTYNVFHVEDAAGSPFVPAQAEFVERYGIASVLGFGGLLVTGDLLAAIMFTRQPVRRPVADRFRTISLSLRVGLLPHILADNQVDERTALAERVTALEQLLNTHEDTAFQQARAMESTTARLRQLVQAATRAHARLRDDEVVALIEHEAGGLFPVDEVEVSLAPRESEALTADYVELQLDPARERAAAMVGRTGELLGSIRLRSASTERFSETDDVLLAQLAQVASAALENARLADQIATEESARSREELLAGMSHEMKTPIAVIAGLLDTLDFDPDDEEDAAVREALLRQTTRLRYLVQRFLAYSALEAGRGVPVRVEPVDVGDVCRAVVRTFHDQRDLVVEVDEDLPVARGDRERIELVVSNLVSNAIKYSPGGTPVTLSARHEDGRVRVEVRDHGDGIAPRDLARVFDRFQRGPNAKGTDGTGLGLYLSRALVEAMGGEIGVGSGSGAGSTFWFSLPPLRLD